MAPVQNDGKEVVVEHLRQLCVFKVANETGKPWVTSRLTPHKPSTSTVSSLLYHPGQEYFPGDRDGWEKSLRGLLEGLKGKASVTGRRMKNFVVGETSWTSFQTLYGYCKDYELLDMKWVVMCSPTCMVAYTPGRFYDPVDTTNEPSSCLLPRGNEARSVAQGDRKIGVPKALIFAAVLAAVGVLFIIFSVIFLEEEENMKRTYNEERNLEGKLRIEDIILLLCFLRFVYFSLLTFCYSLCYVLLSLFLSYLL
ncbi:unnamed protein product [Brassica rapa]|uniref:Uncharacterized protein n=2 Tax=Brassica TaxID=3705 RepID=A0A8D9HAA1_BRACM|nr:unnamed protein product [Brassica napus]CAG7895648.1 unnamed protein product [Brassica rapa]